MNAMTNIETERLAIVVIDADVTGLCRYSRRLGELNVAARLPAARDLAIVVDEP